MARYLSVVGVEAFRERSQSVRNVHTKHGLSVDDISLSLVLSAVDEDYVCTTDSSRCTVASWLYSTVNF